MSYDEFEDAIARLTGDRDGPGHWILGEDGEPQRVGLLTWAHWFEAHPEACTVLRDAVTRGIDVSTVFLGFNAAFTGGPPVLWETMIFGGPFDQFQRRYTSKIAALEGHAAAVRLVEQYRSAPRKTKKVLQKWTANDWPPPRLKPQERRRLARALTGVGCDHF